MRIIGYARISRAADDSTSIPKQRQTIRNTCAARGWDLLDIVEDVDRSATTTRLNRPGLSEVRRRLADGEADALLVWKLDRVARSVVDFGTLLDEGLEIISATEPLDTTTPMGRAMAEILQVFAALESSTTGARLADTKRYLKSVGKWAGGVRPYGYRVIPHPSGQGKALEPHPDEAPIVRRMVTEVLAGRSLYAIAADLNAEGIPSARGRTWSRGTVRRVVRSDAVLGRTRDGGHLLTDGDGVPVTQWPPIVSLDDSARVRAMTEATPTPGRAEATAAGRRNRASRLLSGLLNCGCGAPLVVRRRKERAFYGCAAKARGKPCTRSIFIDAEKVEEEVTRRFLAAVGHLEVFEEVKRRPTVAGLGEVEEAIRDTARQMTEPGADLAGLSARLSTLHARREALDVPAEPVLERVATGRTFAETWEGSGTEMRRALLRSSGVVVEIGPGQRGRWRPERVITHWPSDTDPQADYLAGQID